MTDAAAETRTVVVEREIAHSPEKIWRALTQPHLIEEWLMKNDFEPTVDHKFNLRGDWGAVDCQVLKIQPMRTLSYSWAAHGLESVVTWTLTPTNKGTNLRMEQSGFRPGPKGTVSRDPVCNRAPALVSSLSIGSRQAVGNDH